MGRMGWRFLGMGGYVVRVELSAFASVTKEVVVNAAGENGGSAAQVADFGMQLASRVAAEAAASGQVADAGTGAGRRAGGGLSAQRRGLQALEVAGADELAADASAGGTANAGAQAPTLSGFGDAAGADSVAVSGQVGQTNGLASFSEDEIRQRVEDAVGQARAQGLIPQNGGDPTNAIVSALGGMMQGGGFGGPGEGVGDVAGRVAEAGVVGEAEGLVGVDFGGLIRRRFMGRSFIPETRVRWMRLRFL